MVLQSPLLAGASCTKDLNASCPTEVIGCASCGLGLCLRRSTCPKEDYDLHYTGCAASPAGGKKQCNYVCKCKNKPGPPGPTPPAPPGPAPAPPSPTPPGQINVCNFGDSWAALGQLELANALKPYGVKLHTYAIPGAPVVFFAVTEPNALNNMVTKRNCTHVVLSVGGDDFLEIEPQRGANPDVILAEMLANTDIILDRLFKQHPNVKVYQFGYEIMDWPASPHCRTYGYNLLHKVCPLGVDDVDCCNKQFVKYLQTGYVDVLGARYAGRHPYHPINLLGTLQKAGGVPGADVGHPNLEKYSPSKYVIKDSTPLGCVHLTVPGYNLVYKELGKKMFPGMLSNTTTVLI